MCSSSMTWASRDPCRLTAAAKRFLRARAAVTTYENFERRVEIRLSSLVSWRPTPTQPRSAILSFLGAAETRIQPAGGVSLPADDGALLAGNSSDEKFDHKDCDAGSRSEEERKP